MRTGPRLAVLLAGFSATVLAQDRPLPPEQPLSDSSFKAWYDYIQPDDIERLWEKIPWHRTLTEGLFEARRLKKPVAIWTMQGDPMACT